MLQKERASQKKEHSDKLKEAPVQAQMFAGNVLLWQPKGLSSWQV